MDPLTITTSSIALIRTIVSITSSVATFTEDVRDANIDLNSIRQELTNLSLVLESLAQHADKWELEAQDSDPLVRRILEVIKDCENIIQELDGLLKRYDSGMRRRFAWAIYGKNKAEKISIKLQANNRLLSFALEIVNSVTTHEIRADTARMRRETEATRAELANMRADINRRLDALQRRGELPSGLNVQQWVDEVSDYAESHIGFPSDAVAWSRDYDATVRDTNSDSPRNPAVENEFGEEWVQALREGLVEATVPDPDGNEDRDDSSRSSATPVLQASPSLQPLLRPPKPTRLPISEIDLDSIIDRLLEVRVSLPGRQVQLHEEEIRFLCSKAREVFISQPMLLELEAPLKVRA